MPELPEVETTRQGIAPYLLNKHIEQIIVREHKLRQPIPPTLSSDCVGQSIIDISRRSKYLIIRLTKGALLIHLGMSGHLRIDKPEQPIRKHDHIDMHLSNNLILRYHDPRRFGLWHYTNTEPLHHPLLEKLGPEPLTEEFTGAYLFKRAYGKKQTIKSFIMDNHVVVGIGNIYATESLYLCGIHPITSAGRLGFDRLDHLVQIIKQVLTKAIQCGGTTLKDFYGSDGSPGYFALKLKVYGRQGLSCGQCSTIIEAIQIAGRRSTYCPQCQKKL